MHVSLVKVTAAALVAVLFGLTSLTLAQQAAPQPTNGAAVQPRGTQPTRTYRSYSVSPSNARQSTGAMRTSRTGSRAPSWKRADSKPTGQYNE